MESFLTLHLEVGLTIKDPHSFNDNIMEASSVFKIAKMVKLCKYYRVLRLNYCSGITDDGSEALYSFFTNCAHFICSITVAKFFFFIEETFLPSPLHKGVKKHVLYP